MARSLYTLLLYCAIPFILLRLWWRGRGNPAYRQRWAERFGFVSASPRPCLWLHAVSVGETVAARPLVERLLRDCPQYPLWITTTTPTGSATVQRLFGGRVQHSYLPYDLPDALHRFLQRVQPVLLVVMETEIWPNLYAACGRRGIPLLLANARLSVKSLRGYQRVGGLVRQTLQHVRCIAARSQQDTEHFQVLGATAGQIVVCGNIKFDLAVPTGLTAQAQALRHQWGEQRPVWVAASTHQGEDEIILRVFQQVRQVVPDVLLVLVPRHPERFAAVAELCAQTGLPTVRRSRGETPSPNTAILLGDSMGEMLLWYAAADLAFVGGSLVPHGGHNPLEAAAFAVPVLSGTHIHNFSDIFPPLCAAGGAVLVEDAAAVQRQVLVWLQQPTMRQQVGAAAKQFFQQHQGVVDCLMQQIDKLMKEVKR